MIIHLGTQIQSVFGKLDEAGNVVQQYAVSANEGKPLTVFAIDEFERAHREIAAVREKLVADALAAKTPNVSSSPLVDEESAAGPPSGRAHGRS